MQESDSGKYFYVILEMNILDYASMTNDMLRTKLRELNKGAGQVSKMKRAKLLEHLDMYGQARSRTVRELDGATPMEAPVPNSKPGKKEPRPIHVEESIEDDIRVPVVPKYEVRAVRRPGARLPPAQPAVCKECGKPKD